MVVMYQPNDIRLVPLPVGHYAVLVARGAVRPGQHLPHMHACMRACAGSLTCMRIWSTTSAHVRRGSTPWRSAAERTHMRASRRRWPSHSELHAPYASSGARPATRRQGGVVVQCRTVQYSTVQCSTVQYRGAHQTHAVVRAARCHARRTQVVQQAVEQAHAAAVARRHARHRRCMQRVVLPAAVLLQHLLQLVPHPLRLRAAQQHRLQPQHAAHRTAAQHSASANKSTRDQHSPYAIMMMGRSPSEQRIRGRAHPTGACMHASTRLA